MMPFVTRLLRWVRARDGDLLALRRAGRAAIVMPGLFAIAIEIIANPEIAAFAAFGSFSMLLLASFGGPMADRLRAQAMLALVGAAFVVVGTAVSTVDWLAALVTAVLGFAVLFAGVVSSALASATTALLLALILPVSLAAPFSAVPDRLAGWGMASGAALLAVWLLWPSPSRDPLRRPAATACRAVADQLRAHLAWVLDDVVDPKEHQLAAEHTAEAIAALERAFFATPYRPTGLSTATRVLVRLVDELDWLHAVVLRSCAASRAPRRSICQVKRAAASVLESGAVLLERSGSDPAELRTAMAGLRRALGEMERETSVDLTGDRGDLITALDPTFRAQELSFVTLQIGANLEIVAQAEQRGWRDRLLGARPAGLAAPIASAHERAAAHAARHSVWLHNSLRGGAALGIALGIAAVTGAEHSFWVVLGALSVLRSNALATGQNVVRGLLGTVAGFVAGALLLYAIGTDSTVLWLLLAPAVLVAGFAPSAVSFATGQAAFTLALVILYNILQPIGWHVGLIRVEDVALGCGVSLAVGMLFWPRGAAAALGRSLSEAYAEGARYLDGAVTYGMARCQAAPVGATGDRAPDAEAARAAAAARRLDDAFRTYLIERGAKRVSLAEVSSLVSGVAGLRLAGDAVLDLWRRDEGAPGDRSAARAELGSRAHAVTAWYEQLALSLEGSGEVPEPLAPDGLADDRLLETLARDLGDHDGRAGATAVRMIWTGDHIDAARRLQQTIAGPAREAVGA